jgi:serine/threonine protein kinase
MSNIDPWFVLAEGGYATVYMNSNTNEVKKVMPKYVDEAINVNAMIDLGVHCSYKHVIPGIPTLTKYEIDASNVSLYMPYYGQPLNKVKVQRSDIPHVATKIVETLIHFEDNCLQHTDLKPSNILIDDNGKITIIDYNNITCKLCIDDVNVWNYGYGTWHYVAPEIVHDMKPSSMSVVWSFGLILAYMYGRYPAYDVINCNHKYVHTRSFWKKTLRTVSSNYPDGLPLSPKHVSLMPTKLLLLYQKCVKWDWRDRCSLRDIYKTLTGMTLERSIVTRLQLHVTTSEKDISQTLYTVCEDTNTLHVFVKSLYFYKICSKSIFNVHKRILACACHCFSLLLLGSSVFEDAEFISIVEKRWDIRSWEEIEDLVWQIGMKVYWNVWGKTRDIELAEANTRNVFDRIKRECNISYHT